MDEYIKRELAIEALSRGEGCGNVCRRAIERVLAADVAPVRHGRWIWRNKWEPFEFKYECSICHDGSDLESKYCQNCGARMDGGAD